MHAPPKDDSIKTLSDPQTLLEYDAFLFGVPTRYGNMPAQWKTFWDMTGGIWQTGGYWGKYAGLFISTGTMGGGQESTALAMMSTLTHHGLIYVPLGYKTTFHILGDLSEVRGGSPWGAGTFSVSSLWVGLGLIFADQSRRLPMAPDSQPRRNSRSRRSKARPSMVPFPRSIWRD